MNFGGQDRNNRRVQKDRASSNAAQPRVGVLMPESGSNPQPFGQSQLASGPKPGVADGAGTKESILARIARGLGLDIFFGTSPTRTSSSHAGQRASAVAVGGSGVAGNASLVDPKTILQRQLDKIRNRRSLASQLEFAPAETSLFQNMCEHYQDYAVAHRILATKQPCR